MPAANCTPYNGTPSGVAERGHKFGCSLQTELPLVRPKKDINFDASCELDGCQWDPSDAAKEGYKFRCPLRASCKLSYLQLRAPCKLSYLQWDLLPVWPKKHKSLDASCELGCCPRDPSDADKEGHKFRCPVRTGLLPMGLF